MAPRDLLKDLYFRRTHLGPSGRDLMNSKVVSTSALQHKFNSKMDKSYKPSFTNSSARRRSSLEPFGPH